MGWTLGLHSIGANEQERRERREKDRRYAVYCTVYERISRKGGRGERYW
jgi:hypothetical protein